MPRASAPSARYQRLLRRCAVVGGNCMQIAYHRSPPAGPGNRSGNDARRKQSPATRRNPLDMSAPCAPIRNDSSGHRRVLLTIGRRQMTNGQAMGRQRALLAGRMERWQVAGICAARCRTQLAGACWESGFGYAPRRPDPSPRRAAGIAQAIGGVLPMHAFSRRCLTTLRLPGVSLLPSRRSAARQSKEAQGAIE